MGKKGKGFQTTKWYWWCLNLLHLETLFFVVIVLFSIYIVISGRSKRNSKVSDFEKKWRDLSENAPPNKHSFLGSTSGEPKKPQKKNQHEEKCRDIFQGLFQAPFKSVRPDWLVNPTTGSNLELDGYNPDIITPKGRGVAFEYDGIQHSEYDPHHFHSERRGGQNAFIYQVKKDNWKTKRCAEEGVVLIRIPHYISWDDIEDHIKDRLRKEGVDWKNPIQSRSSGRERSLYD